MPTLAVTVKTLAFRLLPAAARREIRSLLWSWFGLREGTSKPIDLSRLQLVRAADRAALQQPDYLEETLIPALGLNDEGFEQIPTELYPVCGTGLRCWQYPNQFNHYLLLMSELRVESYLEIGVRHGGTFVTMVEYLRRFHPLTKAIAVDLGPCPSLANYRLESTRVEFLQSDSHSPEFRTFIQREQAFDLILIDGDHTEEGCWQDFQTVRDHGAIIGFHDIVSDVVPGVGATWRRVRAEYAEAYEFFEFTAQYESLAQRTGKRFLGLGVAVRKGRPGLPDGSYNVPK